MSFILAGLAQQQQKDFGDGYAPDDKEEEF